MKDDWFNGEVIANEGPLLGDIYCQHALAKRIV